MNNHKTPVSLLQEVCAKRGLTPNYELLSNQGSTHEPLYIYKCAAGETIAQAKGTSKKKAKHYVALLVLIQMIRNCKENPNVANKLFIEEVKNSAVGLFGTDITYDLLSEFTTNFSEIKDIADHLDTNTPLPCPVNEEELGNPIGTLQEYCQRNMWPQPTYDFKIYQHQHESHCILKLWKWSVQGVGKSRKLAKRRAALNMLDKLKTENLSIPRDTLDMMEEGTLKLDDDEEPKVDTSKSPDLASLIQKAYMRNLKGLYNSKGNVTKEKLEVPERNCCEKLDDVCHRQGLKTLYTYMRNTNSGNVYCLLQLNSDPVHVIRGYGATMEEARENAARECLQFIVNMNVPMVLRDIKL